MKEERLSQRIEIELPAKFCFQAQPKVWIDAMVINISTHGFCFRTNAKLTEALSQKPVVRLGVAISKREDVALEIQTVWAGKTSHYHCLAGGEILNPSGPDYQKVLDFYTRIFRERSQ